MKTFVIYFSAAVTVLLLVLGSLRLHPYYRLAKKQNVMIIGNTPHVFKDTLKILSILLLISIISGIVLELIAKFI